VIPQAFPLYVIIVDGDSTEKWLVVGWCPIENGTELDILWPMVVPIGSSAHNHASSFRPPVDAQTIWVLE
jgi:hypothetical protein